MFLPGLPPPSTFTGAPVFPNPFAPEGALAAAGRETETEKETDREAETRQALSVLRPLLEPLLRRRGVAWADAVPTLNRGDQASALDLALRGADADATSQALEEVLAAVGSGTAPADASVDRSGYEEVYHATVAKAAATDGSGTDRETTPETAPELLRSQKRKLKDAEQERRRSKRRIAEPAELTLPTAGLAGRGEETIGRAAMMEALQQSQPVVGLPVKSETDAPVVPIELPPDGSAGGDALAAAAAAAEELDAQAEREKRKLPPEQLPVVEQPLTPIISSQLKTLLADLVARGLPGVTESGQATGIFDIDLGEAVPHYREVVAEPMDLGTMKRKVERGAYATVGDFEGDFRKLIIACNQYNLRDPSHPGYRDGQYYLKLARVLEAQFESRWEKLLDSVAEQQAAAAAKSKKKLARGSAAAGGGGGVKLALGGAQVGGGGAGGKKSRPTHLRNAAYWRGDEGVARAVRARVEAEEAEGKELGRGRGAGDGGRRGRGGARSTRDILLANRHRESEPAAAAAAGGGAAKSAASAGGSASAASGFVLPGADPNGFRSAAVQDAVAAEIAARPGGQNTTDTA